MSGKVTKVLIGVLCSIMLWIAMPGEMIFASESGDEYAEPLTWYETENGDIYFYNFEEFKEVATGDYSTPIFAYYRGTEPLVIEEDVVIAEHIIFDFVFDEVHIAPGVTLTATHEYLFFGDLNVEGTLVNNCSLGSTQVYGNLNVTGEIINNALFMIHSAEKTENVTGSDKITYGENGSLVYLYDCDDMDSLKTAVANASIENDSHVGHMVYLGENAEFVINESIKIPKNVRVNIFERNYKVTIADGCRVDLYGDLYLAGTMDISGTLNNVGNASISHNTAGILTILNGGSYIGHGIFTISKNGVEEADIPDVLPGFDLTKYTIKETADGLGWELKYNTGFEDVDVDAYYEIPVQWAVENGITNGHGSSTTFCPELDCTRGQVVTFLWRAKGCPEPASLENPFTDVAEDAYYYKAVLWAVEQGITNGYGSETTFCPDMECTRGQVATFMWRAEGKPAVNNAQNTFTDVKSGEYYYDAVLWAVENGVTNGYGSADTFCPDVICNRGQIVTFLYRGMN